MSIWFTADLHLGHERIIELCDRPFPNVEAMNTAIVDRWNETVAPGDTVWVLGDVCMGRIADTLPLVGELNGYKILIPGNHDRVWPTYWPERQRDRKLPEWTARYLEVFQEVERTIPTYARLRAKDYSLWIVKLAHLPRTLEDKDHDREAHLAAYRPTDGRLPLLHGHVHNAWKVNGNQVNVGVDVNDFRPVPEHEVMSSLGVPVA